MLLALPLARSEDEPTKNDTAPWLVSLAAGYQQAQSDQQPIIVRIGGKACQQCLLLEQEIAKPAAQLALKQWTRVYIDVDESPADARLMAVGPIPALRLLTSQGKLVATHDGKMTDAEFVKWLQEHHAAAAAKLAPELTRTGPPTELDIVRLIQQFKLRDATIREAALRRLAPYPHTAADGVVTALIEGNLSSRLMSLELLQQWQAPVEGLDPWQPDTITDERVDQLSTWIATLTPPEKSEQLETKVAQQISAEDLDAARKTIASMIPANASQARAMRERLARFGTALLPEVYASLKTADTDNARRRLTALRYRLVASDKLVLNWPGGLQSLAATDEATRMAAADELSRRATEQDEALLLELFSDPAPLIREISLRTLQKVGGNQTQTALIRLLEDPEPNVRAAVLKQLTEESPRNLVPQIAKYVEGEENADLVVHAVRFLREAGGREAVACLKTLIVDPSWQVRAEAAEAIGDIANNERGVTSSEKAKAYKVLIKTLKDEDSFVVSRAVKGLSEAHLSSAVEPMIQVAHAHPDLAQDVITMLARDDANQKIVLPHLRKFFNHKQPNVRAAAIEGLVTLHSKQVGEELGTALKDSDPQVRIAAGQALFQMLDRLRQQEMNQSIYTDIDSGDYVTIESSDEWVESSPSILGQLLGGLFGGGKTSKPKVVDEPADEEPESVDEPAKVVIEKQDGEADAEVGEVTLIEADAAETGTEADPDAQLKEIRTGKHHPDWAFALADPLLPLLKGETAEERLAGALPLAALGRDKEAISVLRELTAAHPELVAKIAQALPWLLWEDRQELFRELVPAAKDETGLSRIAGIISQTKNDNNAELLWSLINHEAATVDTLTGVSYSIRELHFPDYYYSPTNALCPSPQRGHQSRAAAGQSRYALAANYCDGVIDADCPRRHCRAGAGDCGRSGYSSGLSCRCVSNLAAHTVQNRQPENCDCRTVG